MSTKADDFIQSQLPAILRPGEQVQFTASVLRAPSLLLQILLLGGLISFLLTKAYFAVATNQRVILIRTSMGLFGPGLANKGIEEIPLQSVTRLKLGGFLNNRSMTFVDASGKEDTIRIAPWSKAVSGQKAFFEGLPAAINNRQLTA
jgi:hypothetical protein